MAQQTANDIASVPWIDKTFILKALRNSGDEKSNVTDVTVRYAVASGENYTSTIYRVEVTLDDGRQRSLMVKGPSLGEELATFAKMAGIFWREGGMLADAIPKMEALLDAAAPNKLHRFAARCLHYGCENNVEFLVMEDLAHSGFKMADRKRGLGLRHSLLALRSLARFHAASHALLRQQPELADGYDNMWRKPNHNMTEFIQGLVQSAADVCRTWIGFEKFVDILEKLKLKIRDLCIEINDPKPDSFNVITHGDFWVNNMMFRYENGDPVEFRMVDLQISHVASPAVDLQYFLSTSVSDDVYFNHRDLLLREYLFSLEETLQLLGIKAPPREAFLAAMDEHGIMAMFGALCIKPIALTPSTPDLEASNTGDHSGIAFMYQTPRIKRWLQTTLQEFSRKGWLKEQ
ncbi:hypothetical protein R5R35_001154 [Gryllus longicercus]|uniref:CHK kinase-like domain-containing protein n=1 Tax=Gryllus longicercus TaxID=2509291 RepID=A0AAN9VWM7_9ORTH